VIRLRRVPGMLGALAMLASGGASAQQAAPSAPDAAALPRAVAAAPAGATAPAAAAALEVGGKRILLPPGAWRTLAQADYAVDGRRIGETGQLRSIVQGWTIGGRVVALAVVRANVAPVAGGFGLASDCGRLDIHLGRTETPRGSALASCSFVTHLLHDAAPLNDPAWRAALARLAAEDIAAPATWLVAGFRMADDDDLLDLRILLDPSLLGLAEPGSAMPVAGTLGAVGGWLRGITGQPAPAPPTRWQRSGWAPAAIASDPLRALVVAHVVGWIDEVRTPMRLGFKARRDVTAPGWPGPWQVALGLAPPPVEPLGSGVMLDQSARTEALWKTLSWRVVGSTLDTAVALALTGSVGVAGGITLIGGTVNAAAYYLHELVWDDVTARGSAGESITDLPSIGEDR
jgi:uncharacterized membrane protein